MEILTIPRTKFKDVDVTQNGNTKYSIPSPGIANIMLPSKGYGGVFVQKGNNLEQIYQFKGEEMQHRITLLPGMYKVVFRAKSAKEYIYTNEKDFKLKSGQSELIKIY